MLLTLWHPGRACINFLWLYVPHVLWYDEDQMAKDFIGTWAGILLLTKVI